MGAFTGGGDVSAPRGGWDAIAERVRAGYLRELDEVLGGDAT